MTLTFPPELNHFFVPSCADEFGFVMSNDNFIVSILSTNLIWSCGWVLR